MNEQRKPNLIVDFDGVIHSYTSGWQGADEIPDPPVPGAAEWLAEAVEHFTINIHSSRTHQSGGVRAMKEYCALEFGHAIAEQLHFPDHKPPAILTIDDRVFRFEGLWPTIDEIKNFQPWNKKEI